MIGIDISQAVKELEKMGIEAFEGKGSILVISCESHEEIYNMAEKARRIFREIGYYKSWQIDHYFYQRRRNEDGSVFLGPE